MTNIASVLLKDGHPDLHIVSTWLAESHDADVRLTAITRAEVDYRIAAIAKAAGATVATRDVDGFLGCGIPVVNPYDGAEAFLQSVELRLQNSA